MTSSQVIIQLLISFLGGGVVVAIIEVLHRNKTDKIERKANRLHAQIENFYGPLCILILQNERLFDIYNRIHQAYKVEYIDKKWSEEKLTQDRLKESGTNTIEIGNQYVKEVESNNDRIYELIETAYAYADTEDTDLIIDFYEHHIRLKTERSGGPGKLDLPFEIYTHLGEISFMKPELISLIKEKTQAKKKELAVL